MQLGEIALLETSKLNLTTDYSVDEFILVLVFQLDFHEILMGERRGHWHSIV